MKTEDGFIVVESETLCPTNSEIEKIKGGLGEEDTLDNKEFKKFKENRIKSGLDKIVLAHLFIQCIDVIKNNLDRAKSKDEEIISGRIKLKKYLKKVDDDNLRNLIEEFNDGKNYGYHYIGLKIKDIVKENRADMDIVISIFFTLFEEYE